VTAEGLSERRLTTQDCAACVPLSAEPQWNQVAADWRLMIEAGDSFAMFAPGQRLVASGLTVPYDGPFGWISMILVTQPFRRRGLATHLMRRCMDALLAGGRTPALDATPEGRQVYLRLGFQDVYRLTRFVAQAPKPVPAAPPAGATIRPMLASDLPAVAAYDRGPFGAGRATILADLQRRMPAAAFLAEKGGRLHGFALARDGRRCAQIGPVVAEDAATATALTMAALAGIEGPVCIDAGDQHTELAESLKAAGFAPLLPFIRMIHGRSEPYDDPARIFVIGGPELG
jgi:GNAT superfamily N-acetyltransferase